MGQPQKGSFGTIMLYMRTTTTYAKFFPQSKAFNNTFCLIYNSA